MLRLCATTLIVFLLLFSALADAHAPKPDLKGNIRPHMLGTWIGTFESATWVITFTADYNGSCEIHFPATQDKPRRVEKYKIKMWRGSSEQQVAFTCIDDDRNTHDFESWGPAIQYPYQVFKRPHIPESFSAIRLDELRRVLPKE